MSPQATYDAIVLGGGIMGAATAEALARRGRRALLLEQFAPGHTHGSSHGDGRIFRFAYPQEIYVRMMILARPAWEELGKRAGQPLIQTTGGWDCGPADSPVLAGLEANFQHYGLPYERLSAADSNRRFPHFRLERGDEAIYQPDAGVIFATPAVLALWGLVQAEGAAAISGERVVAIEAQGEQITVRGASGASWTAPRLVITAGGWARGLLAELQRFARQRLPHLDLMPIERVTCLYTNTPDEHFILDRHPDLPNVIIGAGFSGHGFKFGPVVGQALAALALDEPPPLPLEMFSLRRFSAREVDNSPTLS